MPEAFPRVVATDLDGTLLRSDGSLSARTRATIAAAERAGVTVVFVTARPPRRIDELADAVGEHGVAICANGAFEYDVASRRIAQHISIDRALLEEVLDDLRVAVPGIAFAVEGVEGMGREERFFSIWGNLECTVAELPDLIAKPVGKLLGRSDDLEPDEFHRRVADVLDGRVELGYSGAVGLAEITAKGVTKAAGLERWCEQRDVPAERVWAFGDMPNDLPMLSWAGRAYAVGNAHPDVRAVADEVVATNDADGVAATLDELLRGAQDSPG